MVHARNAVTGKCPGILHGAAGFVTCGAVCVLVLVLLYALPRTFLSSLAFPCMNLSFLRLIFFLFTFAFAFSTFFLSRRLATFHDTGLAFSYVQTHFFYPHYFDFT